MRFARTYVALSFLAIPALARQTSSIVQRDPQALTLAKLSVEAILGNQSLTDATLQGSANFIAGSDEETGSFTLEVKGNQQSKLVLNLSGGPRQEIRRLQAGAWVGPDGLKRPIALHNCWTDASSLIPVFTLGAAITNSQTSAVYLGQAIISGTTADHLQLSQVVAGENQKMTAEIQQLSTMDIYLDPVSHLPVAVTFSAHPDDNLRLSFPVKIQFSAYRQLGGMQVPTRVQKLLQGSLVLDLAVATVVTNTGISDSEFSTQ